MHFSSGFLSGYCKYAKKCDENQKKGEKKCYTFVKPKKNLIFVGDCLTNENY